MEKKLGDEFAGFNRKLDTRAAILQKELMYIGLYENFHKKEHSQHARWSNELISVNQARQKVMQKHCAMRTVTPEELELRRFAAQSTNRFDVYFRVFDANFNRKIDDEIDLDSYLDSSSDDESANRFFERNRLRREQQAQALQDQKKRDAQRERIRAARFESQNFFDSDSDSDWEEFNTAIAATGVQLLPKGFVPKGFAHRRKTDFIKKSKK